MFVRKKILLWIVIAYSLGNLATVYGINILGIVTSSSRAHNHHAAAIFDELASSGHSVTVLSPYPQSQKINHFQLDDTFRRERVKDRSENRFHPDVLDSYSETLRLYNDGVDRTKSVAGDPSFRKLLAADTIVDVIVFDYDYNEALLGLADYFNCPVIVLNIGRLRGLVPRLLRVPYPLHNYFNYLQHSYGNPVEIITSWSSVLFEQLFIDLIYHKQQQNLYEDIFGLGAVPFSDCYHHSVAKVFISTLSDKPLLAPTDIVDVTGAHIPSTNFFKYSLPERLDSFIDSADSGCIYVSFGDVNPLTLPKDKINTLFRVLYTRPEKVIWAWNGNTSAFGNSPDFYLDRWLPQNEILRHRNVKLFISSGGQLSIIEAIHNEVPTIGIPLTHEQSAALESIQSQGLGIKLELHNVSSVSLAWALGEVLDKNRFHDNLVNKYESSQDQPMSPMKLIKFWVNYVFRHRHSIRSRRTQIHFSAGYYFLNVYATSLIVLVALVFSIVFISRRLRGVAARIVANRKLKLY